MAKIPTPAYAAMLKLLGITEDQFFDEMADSHGLTIAPVFEVLARQLSDLEDAERAAARNLDHTRGCIQREEEAITNEMALNGSWVLHYAQKYAESVARVQRQIETIRPMVPIFKGLRATNSI